MGIGIGFAILFAVSALLLLVSFLKSKRMRQEAAENILSHQNVELSSSKQTSFNAPNVGNSSKQGKDNFDEYDEVVSPASKTNKYETMPAHQLDDQDHIYSKI